MGNLKDVIGYMVMACVGFMALAYVLFMFGGAVFFILKIIQFALHVII
jgi:hypothetical protein